MKLFITGALFGLIVGFASHTLAKSWPSANGTTAQGVVIENGVDGTKIAACGS